MKYPLAIAALLALTIAPAGAGERLPNGWCLSSPCPALDPVAKPTNPNWPGPAVVHTVLTAKELEAAERDAKFKELLAKAKPYPLDYHPEYTSADVAAAKRRVNEKWHHPPAEYDHPFSGPRLIIIELASQEALRLWCRIDKMRGMTFAGCAGINKLGMCLIYLDTKEIAKQRWTVNLALRHEIAHCNGWPKDHRGATASIRSAQK
jgi:hypothetical protein